MPYRLPGEMLTAAAVWRTPTRERLRNLPTIQRFAVTGLAAEDAEAIAIVVDGQEHREPIGVDGLAFAFARARGDSEPEVIVHTRDGRAVTAVR
ncbi:hypothetical protein ABIA39_007439 [Nocardia sp. GAS34]|uniref:hypothetical protein n=1 Tax=unclassified Nocardia TaxID=2637762 RepID=UPI003D216E8C